MTNVRSLAAVLAVLGFAFTVAAQTQAGPHAGGIGPGNDRRRLMAVLQRHPVCRAACGRFALARATAARVVEGRACRRQIRSGMHADSHIVMPALGLDATDRQWWCLYLNVWTPAKSPKDHLAVMVWIYGGGIFDRRHFDLPQYDGENLAKKGVGVRQHSLSAWAVQLLRSPDLSAENARPLGQLWTARPDRRITVGEAQYRRIRRKSKSRDNLWRVGRRNRCQHARRFAVGEGTFPRRYLREWWIVCARSLLE